MARIEVITDYGKETTIYGFNKLSNKYIPYTISLGDSIFKAKGSLYTVVSHIISEKTMEKINKIKKLHDALYWLIYEKKGKKYIVGD